MVYLTALQACRASLSGQCWGISTQTESDKIYPKSAPVGDPLEVPKDPHVTRFFFQNTNGLTLGNGNTFEDALEQAKLLGCDHLVIPETKLDTHKRWVKAKVHNHCRRLFGSGQYRAVTSASSKEFKSDTMAKPGGVLSVTLGPLIGRVIETGSDKYGRWVYSKFSASGPKNITVIGIYQPCDVAVNATGPIVLI